MQFRTYQVYIATNKNNTVLYTGVTNNLVRRMEEHKFKRNPKSFTARYNVDKLVWYENYMDIVEAIEREKQLKAGSRSKKIQLIEKMNPEWRDLYEVIQTHQLSTKSTEGIPMGEPFSPKKNCSLYNIPAPNFPSFNKSCFGPGC
jgi:putative endonuclease